jgi:hypothetical protein
VCAAGDGGRSVLIFCEDMKVVILVASLILSAALDGHAQSNWHVFSPPDKSFRIETPVLLNRIDDMYGDSSPEGYKAIDVFGGESKSQGSFLIVTLTPSEEMRRKNPNGNEIGGLEFVIGGDNAQPLKEESIIVRGLKGKEFIYESSRGQILDAGERVFILAYVGRNAKNLTSPAATRFFNSFRSML